jgi:hypothetical protein
MQYERSLTFNDLYKHPVRRTHNLLREKEVGKGKDRVQGSMLGI